jgi:hypothetical protein
MRCISLLSPSFIKHDQPRPHCHHHDHQQLLLLLFFCVHWIEIIDLFFIFIFIAFSFLLICSACVKMGVVMMVVVALFLYGFFFYVLASGSLSHAPLPILDFRNSPRRGDGTRHINILLLLFLCYFAHGLQTTAKQMLTIAYLSIDHIPLLLLGVR